jgi:hypothetical protein
MKYFVFLNLEAENFARVTLKILLLISAQKSGIRQKIELRPVLWLRGQCSFPTSWRFEFQPLWED